MPAAGVEYRYPFVDVEPWGTQTVEPIAQLILRPNETEIGKFPNEDAQSLVFDDLNLFSIDKYSGLGPRRRRQPASMPACNIPRRSTAPARSMSCSVNPMPLFGQNSFAVADITNTGLESGLDKPISDYVGSVTYQPNHVYSFTARGRFDEATFTPQRLEFESRANFDRWTLQLLYGDYAAQPLLGFLTRREDILAGASVKLTQNWVVLGSARYDIANDQFDQIPAWHWLCRRLLHVVR